MKIAPAGDRALLLDLGNISAAELHATAAAMRSLPGAIKAVPGQSSVLVVFDHAPAFVEVSGAGAIAPVHSSSRHHTIPVSFHDEYAPDLAEFLAHASITRDAFLQRFARLTLVVRYIGFRGGFGYLDGWPEEWAMARRATSRPVKAGTFAVAGGVAAFYPIDSPGGWNLLGRTAYPLENGLEPGDTIAIHPTFDAVPERRIARAAAHSWFPLEIVSSPLAQVVEIPFDDIAAAQANRAVGNAPEAPLLECAMRGPRVIARRDVICAWYGDEPEQFALKKGEEWQAGHITKGLRGYLAAGDVRGPLEPLQRGGRLSINAMAGPHESDIRELVCEVTSQLDRVGIRMRVIEPRDMTAPAALPSCGMLCGTVQLHPDGSAVAMGPDHPVTGGYLQPMTVISSERWKLAQLMPGEIVSFRI